MMQRQPLILRLSFIACALAVLAATPLARAHRPFEATTVGRLQHGRLELTVTISSVMANYLLREILLPGADPFSPETLDQHREALLRLAPDFLRLRAGQTSLRPEKIQIALNPSREPEFAFVYPLPSGPGLLVSAGTLQAPGREGFNVIRFFDDDENLLASGVLASPPDKQEITITLPPAPVPAPSSSGNP